MKKRADILLYEKALAPSREKARLLIMEGRVYVADTKVLKAGEQLAEDAELTVRGNALRYVSRGGLKLEKAMSEFSVSLEGAVCADIGCSTGGFTDCMLQNGAAHVFAVDVGYGQLAWSIRTDERVSVLERTNARYLTEKEIPLPVDFASVDVSFISLKLILPPLAKLLAPNGKIVCLVKPQFEAGRELVGKHGVVRDPAVHIQVIENAMQYARDCSLTPLALTYSPIKGPEGNIEFLLLLGNGTTDVDKQPDPEKIVAEAHTSLKVDS